MVPVPHNTCGLEVIGKRVKTLTSRCGLFRLVLLESDHCGEVDRESRMSTLSVRVSVQSRMLTVTGMVSGL